MNNPANLVGVSRIDRFRRLFLRLPGSFDLLWDTKNDNDVVKSLFDASDAESGVSLRDENLKHSIFDTGEYHAAM